MGGSIGSPITATPLDNRTATPVYLLVGMRNKVFDNPSGNTNTNLNDFNSLWVAIDAATGLIVVADPAAIGTTATGANGVLPTPPTNSDSRASPGRRS